MSSPVLCVGPALGKRATHGRVGVGRGVELRVPVAGGDGHVAFPWDDILQLPGDGVQLFALCVDAAGMWTLTSLSFRWLACGPCANRSVAVVKRVW